MHPRRLSVKYFLSDPAAVDPAKVVPVFQRWIQKQMVEGLLIDVADYKHVVNGPGVILIGDEGDYAFNLNDGRPGLMYTRKRQMPETLHESLRQAFRLVLVASQKFSQERVLGHPKIDAAEAEITFLDRLQTPNTSDQFATLKDAVAAFSSGLYPDLPLTIESIHTDHRECLAIRIRVSGNTDNDALLEHLATEDTVKS